MGGFAQPETSRDGKPDLCYHGKGFFNTSFRTSVWWAIMQSLAQYLARKTLGGVMLLTYLLGLPSWQPVTPSDIGVRLPGWEGGWEARAAARFYMVHWLLQLLLLCLQHWPASGCACIKRAGWKSCTPQHWCVFTWVWEVLGLQYFGGRGEYKLLFKIILSFSTLQTTSWTAESVVRVVKNSKCDLRPLLCI